MKNITKCVDLLQNWRQHHHYQAEIPHLGSNNSHLLSHVIKITGIF